MKSFTIFEEYYDLITLLNDKDQQELLLAIVKFMFEDIEPVLNEKQTKIFKNLRRPLEVSKNKSKCKQNKTKTKSNKNQKEIKKETKQNQNEVSDSSFVTKSMSMSMSNKSMSKFKKPNIEEIEEYCKERNNGINANTFYDFYESKGWKVGNQPMKNWQACIRTWEKRNKPEKQEDLPDWWDKGIEKEVLSEKENNELKEMISKYE